MQKIKINALVGRGRVLPRGILLTLLVMVGGISMMRVPDWGGGRAPGRGHGPASY